MSEKKASPGPVTHLPRQWRGVGSIGVVGSRGTGKTCYLGAAYGAKTESTGPDGEWVSTVGSQDEATSEALRKIWAFLKCGKVPPANAVALPTELSLRLTWETPLGKRRWSFSTIDYSGEFIQLGKSSAPELKGEVRKWLAGCDAVLFFVGLGDPDLESRLDELDVFITELQKQSGRKDRLTLPVGLVLTKWDVEGTIGSDLAAEEARAARFVQTDPQFRKIAATVKACGDWVRVFPVSAFGASRDDAGGMAPPPGGAEPFNVLAPLVWASEQASNLKSSRFVRRAKTFAGMAAALFLAVAGLYLWDTSKYNQARAALADDRAAPETVQAACDAYGDMVSPFKHLLGRKSEIATGRAQFNDRTAVALAYERCTREPTADHQQEFLNSAKAYLTGWPGSRHELTLRDQIAEVYPKLVQGSFAVYHDFRKANPGIDKAALLAEKGRELIGRFPDAPQGEQLKLLVAQDDARARQFNDSGALITRLRVAEAEADKLTNADQKYERLAREKAKIGPDSGYTPEAVQAVKKFDEVIDQALKAMDASWRTAARADVARDPTDPDRVERAWGEYLRKGGVLFRSEAEKELAKVPGLRCEKDWAATFAAVPRAPKKAEECKTAIAALKAHCNKYKETPHKEAAEKTIEKLRENYRDLLWTSAQADIASSPGAYGTHIDLLQAVARDADAGDDYKARAKEQIRATETKWDQIEYEKFRSAADGARTNPTGTTITNADDAARRYLTGDRNCPRAANAEAAAKAFRKWVADQSIEHDVKIKVVKAEVPKGSDIDGFTGGPECKITVTLNGTSFSTKTHSESRNPVYNEELGPFKFRWGKQKLKVRITDVDKFGGDDVAEADSVEDEFILGKANGTFEIVCKKKKTIKVYLECEQAKVPDVPAYSN